MGRRSNLERAVNLWGLSRGLKDESTIGSLLRTSYFGRQVYEDLEDMLSDGDDAEIDRTIARLQEMKSKKRGLF